MLKDEIEKKKVNEKKKKKKLKSTKLTLKLAARVMRLE